MLLTEQELTIANFEQIVFQGEKIEIADSVKELIAENFKFLKTFSKDKIIYGINTGLGPMAQFRISEQDHIQLQYNLIRSHCAGSGNRLPEQVVRAIILSRMSSLTKGYSGINMAVIDLLKEFINHEIYPVIFEHGGVGASGDLVQLAHLGLALIGEGSMTHRNKEYEAAELFGKFSLSPLKIELREGLAVMNGTGAMTGIGLINIVHAKKLLNHAIMAAAMIVEIVESYDDHFSAELNKVKLHEGQNEVAKSIRTMLSDSKLIRKRSDHLYSKKIEEHVLENKVQEFYSVRCVPQILGPVMDTIHYSSQVLVNELNSVNDNPVIDHKQKDVFHGGNFHGDYVALEMDKLKIAVTKLCMLSERQLNYLLNDSLNEKLTPFINTGKLGVNLGLQGIQFTATSTTSENQTLSFPSYIHSIPSNKDNQDIVSMGANAALITQKVIENTFEVLAIEFIAIVRAIDSINLKDKLSSQTGKFYAELKKVIDPDTSDRVLYKDILNIKELLKKIAADSQII